jgi:hypothetical protein
MTKLSDVVLPLIVTDAWKGYAVEDISAALDEGDWEIFQRWFNGQTGAISERGQLIVYAYDWERFVNGFAPYD